MIELLHNVWGMLSFALLLDENIILMILMLNYIISGNVWEVSRTGKCSFTFDLSYCAGIYAFLVMLALFTSVILMEKIEKYVIKSHANDFSKWI